MKRLLFVTVIALLPTSFARADIIIDNFSSNQLLVTSTWDHNQSGPNSGVLGSYREMRLNIIPPDPDGGASLAQVTSGNRRLSLNNGDGLKSTLELRYDGSSFGGAYNTSGLSPTVDATESGHNLGIGFTARNDYGSTTDGIGATVTFTLNSTGGGESTYSVTLVESGTAFVSYFIPFLWFTGTADLSQLSAMKIFVDSTNDTAQDVVFTTFSFTTPAPSGLILGAFALAIGGGYAWRQRRLSARPAV
jgi:hypothetical protein